MDETNDEVKQVIEKHGQLLVDMLERALPRSKDATTDLRESIRFNISVAGGAYYFDLYLLDYYKWVDEGRKPGKMPWDKSKGLGDEGNVILQWIKDKRLIIHPKRGLTQKTKGSKIKELSDNLTEARKMAFMIGLKIKHKGIKATPFFSNTVPKWMKAFQKDLAETFKHQIVAEIRKVNSK